MSKSAQTVLVVLLAALLTGFHLGLKERPDERQIDFMADQISRPREWVGKVAPDFELTLRDGSTFRLADEIGSRVTVLNFFATWCAPCRAEMPELTRYAESRSEDPFVLIGIDGDESPELVDRFIRDVGVGFPVGIDDGEIAAKYGVRTIPTTVVIGPDGRISLYETTAIMNAEVALDGPVARGLAQIEGGLGTSKDQYLAMLASESFDGLSQPAASDSSEIRMTGRARELATGMGCVCGCEERLLECTCQVADGMRAKLEEMTADESFGDVEIMEAVNAEFCMKEM